LIELAGETVKEHDAQLVRRRGSGRRDGLDLVDNRQESVIVGVDVLLVKHLECVESSVEEKKSLLVITGVAAHNFVQELRREVVLWKREKDGALVALQRIGDEEVGHNGLGGRTRAGSVDGVGEVAEFEDGGQRRVPVDEVLVVLQRLQKLGSISETNSLVGCG
jgi:hypothetical protein